MKLTTVAVRTVPCLIIKMVSEEKSSAFSLEQEKTSIQHKQKICIFITCANVLILMTIFFIFCFHFFRCVFFSIRKVLITKLRSANTVETRQYRKASKALLVLIPLLGITYLVVLAGPNEGVGSYIFVVARAFLLSTQVNCPLIVIHSVALFLCQSCFHFVLFLSCFIRIFLFIFLRLFLPSCFVCSIHCKCSVNLSSSSSRSEPMLPFPLSDTLFLGFSRCLFISTFM